MLGLLQSRSINEKPFNERLRNRCESNEMAMS